MRDDEEISLENYLINNLFNTKLNIEHNVRLIAALEAIDSLIDFKNDRFDGVSLEAYNIIGNILAENTNVLGSSIVNSKMSLEELISNKEQAFKSLSSGLNHIGRRILDTIRYSLSLFEFQSKRLKKLREELSKTEFDTKRVSIPVTIYLQYGHNRENVQSAKEYIDEFRKMVDVVTNVVNLMEVLVKRDLFSWIKFISSEIKGDTDKFISERIEESKREYNQLISSAKLKKEDSGVNVRDPKGRSDIYASDVLLGCFQIETYMPKGELTLEFGKFNFYSFDITRYSDTKRKDSTHPRSVEIEFNKSEAQELLNEVEKLLKDVNRLNTFEGRLNELLRINTNTSISSLASNILSRLITKAGRVSLAIYSSVSSGFTSTYNIGFSNIRQALTIVEKTIK